MKKISFILTAALGVWAFSSCCADKDPMYHRPAEGMIVNEPVLQDNYIILTEGESLDLITSQPDYGYSAIAQYAAQMSLTPDFNTYADVKLMSTTQAAMQMRQEYISIGFCKLLGIETEEAWEEAFPEGAPFQTIYFRATSQLQGVYGSYIVSQNVVSYNYLKPYFAVEFPGKLYLIGSPQGWNIGDGSLYLSEAEDAIGSKVYSAYIDLPAAPMFRFYTELGDWEVNSIGMQVPDNATDIELVDGSYAGTAVDGKGSWNIPDWPGGYMYMEVDLSDSNNYTVEFVAAPDYNPAAE